MKECYERIKARCNELGITPGGMCAKLGVRNGIMSEMKKDSCKAIFSDKLLMFAQFLHVSVDWLLTGKDASDFTDDERRLVHAWRMASDDERENIAFMLRNYEDIAPPKTERAKRDA